MAEQKQGEQDPSDAQVVIGIGEREAVVSPFGASLRGFYRRTSTGERQEIVTLYDGADPPAVPGHKVAGQGDVLIPFPGRVSGGSYHFQGQEYQMERNDHDGPNAIHGFVRNVLWDVDAESSTRAAFSVSVDPGAHPGYPFSLRVQMAYEVDASGLSCTFAVENTGDGPAPVAAGFHPYFTTGSPLIDEDELHLPFSSMLEMVNLIPTGKIIPVEGTPFDFRVPRKIGSVRLDSCFLHPVRDDDGLIVVRINSHKTGRAVSVWMDDTYNYTVLYSGDPLPPEHRRRSLAIEPMTCGSDAFNHPDWGLRVLQPGEKMEGSWGVIDG